MKNARRLVGGPGFISTNLDKPKKPSKVYNDKFGDKCELCGCNIPQGNKICVQCELLIDKYGG